MLLHHAASNRTPGCTPGKDNGGSTHVHVAHTCRVKLEYLARSCGWSARHPRTSCAVSAVLQSGIGQMSCFLDTCAPDTLSPKKWLLQVKHSRCPQLKMATCLHEPATSAPQDQRTQGVACPWL